MSGNLMSKTEVDIASQLRRVAIAHIDATNIGEDAVGRGLGVEASAAHAMLERDRWDVELAMRVIDSLGIAIDIAPSYRVRSS